MSGHGTRFGLFEIIAPLGAGGMGDVYRARDTRLHRDVALKLLPKDFAHDAERVARLTREARLLASLSHPNIAAIHGLEEHEGEIALVLELVEGPTLADQLTTGPLAVPKALALAHQVAEAVEAAHARGIIHRDLKPSNLKVTSDGQVKVLDFGVAKALAEDAGSPPNAVATSQITTRSGIVIGTPGYMSPEQATGGTVDRRADVWAFGCVLFEALSGRRPFEGPTMADTLVRVLERDPDWGALPRDVPPELAHLLSRCLRKDVRQRLQDIGDARVEIEELRAGRSTALGMRTLPGRPPRWRTRVPWALAAGLGVIALALLIWGLRREPSAGMRAAHVVVPLPAGVVLPMDTQHPVLALSPDGTRLVFVGEERGTRRLYSRVLAEADARPILGTDGAASPFFSPDGVWIGFFAGKMLWKVATAGGTPVAVHGAVYTTVNKGATWLSSDTVMLAQSTNSGLSLGFVSAERPPSISEWVAVTRDITAAYAWPHALPGGREVVFVERIGAAADQFRVSLLKRADRTVRTLVTGATSPRYSNSGELLFVRDRALFAVTLDVRRSQVAGSESKVLDGIMVETSGAAHFAVSSNGTLAYIAGAPVSDQDELVWVDRDGRATTLLDNGREFSFPRLSPDGSRVAVATPTGSNEDVWIFHLRRRTFDRVTTHPGEDFEPVWSPDGAQLAIASEIGEATGDKGPAVAWTTGHDFRIQALTYTPEGGSFEFPTSWSSDGKWIAYTSDKSGRASDIELLPTSGSRTPKPLISTAAAEMAAMFSPDGRYVAYVSDETGREQVYVQPFPELGPRVQVSTSGGVEPVWNRNGGELFYREGDRLMSVRLAKAVALDPAAPVALFEGHYENVPYGGRCANYDVTPDGRRFLMVRRKNLPRPTEIHIVFNWPAVLLSRSAPPRQ